MREMNKTQIMSHVNQALLLPDISVVDQSHLQRNGISVGFHHIRQVRGILVFRILMACALPRKVRMYIIQ